jgi:DNA-binding NarL/FixJ family response regulator
VVDDHPFVVSALRRVMESEADLAFCGSAPSAVLALSALRRVQADLVIVDLSLEGTNGLELIKHLAAEYPGLPILVLSLYDEQLYASRALRSGAMGYLMKGADVEAILAALRTVLEGKIALSTAMRERLITETVRGDRPPTLLETLSDRELEVLQLIGEGYGTKKIAERLNLRIKTVESHRLHLREKLHLQNSAELVVFARAWVAAQFADGM